MTQWLACCSYTGVSRYLLCKGRGFKSRLEQLFFASILDSQVLIDTESNMVRVFLRFSLCVDEHVSSSPMPPCTECKDALQYRTNYNCGIGMVRLTWVDGYGSSY